MSKWIGKDIYDEKKPCFAYYKFSFGEDDGPMECEDNCENCLHPCPNGVASEDGWHNCPYGALSSWYIDGTPPRAPKEDTDDSA